MARVGCISTIAVLSGWDAKSKRSLRFYHTARDGYDGGFWGTESNETNNRKHPNPRGTRWFMIHRPHGIGDVLSIETNITTAISGMVEGTGQYQASPSSQITASCPSRQEASLSWTGAKMDTRTEGQAGRPAGTTTERAAGKEKKAKANTIGSLRHKLLSRGAVTVIGGLKQACDDWHGEEASTLEHDCSSSRCTSAQRSQSIQ